MSWRNVSTLLCLVLSKSKNVSTRKICTMLQSLLIHPRLLLNPLSSFSVFCVALFVLFVSLSFTGIYQWRTINQNSSPFCRLLVLIWFVVTLVWTASGACCWELNGWCRAVVLKRGPSILILVGWLKVFSLSGTWESVLTQFISWNNLST